MEATTADEPGSHSAVPRRTRTRRRWLICCAVLSLSTLASLVAAEVVVRGYVFYRGWTPNCYAVGTTLLVPEPLNGYTLAENHRFQSGVRRISTNPFGLRGPAITKAKPHGTRRIAVIGGSSVFGYLVSDGEEACRVLEDRLRANGYTVEVINGGVPGYNLIQSGHRYDSHISPLKPDHVILYLGWNDLVYLLNETPDVNIVGLGSCTSAMERMAAQSTLYGLVAHKLLNRTAEFNPSPHLGSQPTEAGTRLFLETLQSSVLRIQRSGADVMICSQVMLAHPGISEAAKPYLAGHGFAADQAIVLGLWLHDTLQQFATTNDIPFIDAYNEIPPTTEMLGDVIHLTVQGEANLAAVWEREIIKLWPKQ